jgi:methylenetetrahydrofolate dehydrogenase (NADP+)/methenyltetrahydrofolate cyclohydrolase
MSAKIIDGKSLAIEVRESLAQTIQTLSARGVRPGLAVVLAGDDPASRLYVRNKIRACEQSGVRWELHEYAHDVPEATLVERIEGLNNDPGVHGILIQLPLPRPLDVSHILDTVSPAKDVDGFHLESLGALAAGRPGFVPCTPAGIMRMLEHERVPLAGRHAVVVGRSNVVGKPLALLLLQRDATVTICHSKTPALADTTRRADVLVAAAGRPGLITADMVKPGACVIDVGTNRLPNGKLAGDVDFDAVREVAGLISPVPGGVGPMTVAMLIANTVRSALQIDTK